MSLTCSLCGSVRKSMTDLNTHLVLFHKSIEPLKFVCEICNYETDSTQGFFAHHQWNHKLTRREIFDRFYAEKVIVDSNGNVDELCLDPKENKCRICGKVTEWAPPRINKWGYNDLCKNHDRERRNNKRKNSCLDKYGTISSSGNLEVKKKVRATNREKFGTETPQKEDWYKKKITDANVLKYGLIPLVCRYSLIKRS